MCKPLGSRQLLKGSNSLEWTCYSMTWRKCYWPFLRENHHRNEFTSSTYKDQKDSWCSLPGPFSAVLHRSVYFYSVQKSPTWLWSHWEMRYLSQWTYRITTNCDRCPHTCVHVFCSLCVWVFSTLPKCNTQILLGRKGVVYLNSALGFGSIELKLTVCINSLVLSWQNLSHYNTWSPGVKGRAWEGTELQWINTWLHIWCQQESGIDNYGTHSEDWDLIGIGGTHSTKWSLPKWRVVTHWYELRNKAGKMKREIIVYVKEPFGCMELFCGRDGLAFFLLCEVDNITTLCIPSCHFPAFWGKVE